MSKMSFFVSDSTGAHRIVSVTIYGQNVQTGFKDENLTHINLARQFLPYFSLKKHEASTAKKMKTQK